MTNTPKVCTKSTPKGLCNICGTFCNLTEDHVPPKGSVNPKKVTIKSLIPFFDKVDPKICRLSQNGMKFKSLCGRCNNERLGSNFDPSLNKFSHDFSKILNANQTIILPGEINIKIQPQKLARSIVGHLLAVEIRNDMAEPLRTAPMVDLMRKYFLDVTLDFPSDFNLYFWPYYIPERQVILRALSISSIEQSGTVITLNGDFLKFYPFAFWLTYKAPKEKILNLIGDKFFSEILIRGHNLDAWTNVSINLIQGNTIREDWPEAPNDTEILLIKDSMCFIAEV
ncbi:hypothetical protein NUACC21_38190 [Scytonema sp. NUACC21]